MMNESHCSDFHHTLNEKYQIEKVPSLFDKLINWELVVSIVILIAHHKDCVNEDHENDKIIEKWPEHEFNSIISDAISLIETTARIFIIDLKFSRLSKHKFECSSCNSFSLRA